MPREWVGWEGDLGIRVAVNAAKIFLFDTGASSCPSQAPHPLTDIVASVLSLLG
jgi:hypothetical protein